MWAKFRSSKISRGGKKLRDVHKSLNVNEEYLCALRTKSYAEIFNKAQSLVNQPCFPSYCHHKFSEILLEPGQESIPEILESAVPSEVPDLKGLMLSYFDLSAEASRICGQLLKNVNQVQFSNRFIQQVLGNLGDWTPAGKAEPIVSDLNLCIDQTNPFSTPNKHDFKLIHERNSFFLNHLKLKRKKVARKIRVIAYIHKATGICITAACGLFVITAVVLAAYTLISLVMGPAIFCLPINHLKKKLLSLKFLKSGVLRKVGQQLDLAAKGTYILDRDLDTVSRLVARLHDEVEHNRAMIQFCLERREDKFALQVVKELRRNDIGFRKQVEELQEHVYLCLLTINRTRALVIKEILTTSSRMEDFGR